MTGVLNFSCDSEIQAHRKPENDEDLARVAKRGSASAVNGMAKRVPEKSWGFHGHYLGCWEWNHKSIRLCIDSMKSSFPNVVTEYSLLCFAEKQLPTRDSIAIQTTYPVTPSSTECSEDTCLT